jgi:hypothetical protein
MQVVINGVAYTIHTEEFETFRCGKKITTVVLRNSGTEICVTTSGYWRKLLGVEG